MNNWKSKFEDLLVSYFGDASIIEGSAELAHATSQDEDMHQEILHLFQNVDSYFKKQSTEPEIISVFAKSVFIDDENEASHFFADLRNFYNLEYEKIIRDQS
jgi:replication-associated recombination protein RarA